MENKSTPNFEHRAVMMNEVLNVVDRIPSGIFVDATLGGGSHSEEILKRHKKAFGAKENWRTIYEECYQYALPQRNLYDGYYEGNIPGQHKMSRVFDSTGIHSVQRFANRIQSGLFPPYKKWCRSI